MVEIVHSSVQFDNMRNVTCTNEQAVWCEPDMTSLECRSRYSTPSYMAGACEMPRSVGVNV